MHYLHTQFSMLCHEGSHTSSDKTHFKISLPCMFHSIMSYVVIFWGNLTALKKSIYHPEKETCFISGRCKEKCLL
jgi:hypothetical protein